ncbi:SRPBCC family protein [Streptomyces fulvoviolaceus]|uniref:SRPBCC family protein n=1 Tax=Streptomyces fulvoviolaceus TaxID=285535 RepID=UPI0004C593EB|nr:hypothetical protein [Streptomyces fulvoviolaceus]
MPIDVTAERVVPLSPERVAAYAMDRRHDAEWTQGVRRAELTREADGGGFGVGAEVTRTAYFLGRRIDYVLRVAGYEPPRLLDMVSVAGPLLARQVRADLVKDLRDLEARLVEQG